MATISNRRNKWQARVRRNGQPTITKTFLTKQDAEKWARSIEIELDRGTYINICSELFIIYFRFITFTIY